MTAADKLKSSLPKFLWYVWTYILLLPKPTRVQLDIARFLTTGGRRRFIQAFRGVGKTFLTAAYVVWRLWDNPDLKIMIVSANETLASEIAGFIKQIIDHEAGDELWPELRARPDQRKASMVFDVGPAKADKSPSVKAVGITGQLTGSRADIVIFDDVEVPKNSETETMREKLENKTKEGAAILKPGGEILYLGTPQSEQTIYGKLPEKGYEVRIWPARYPLGDKLGNYCTHLAPMLMEDIKANPDLMRAIASTLGGAPTDPDRFHDGDLLEREIEYRSAGFLLQYQLDTTLSDAERFPLKTRDLVVMDLDPKVAPARIVWSSSPDLAHKDLENVGFDGDRFYRPMHVSSDYLEYTGSVMMIDPSGRGRDRTTYAVAKFLCGYIFITAWGGFSDGYGTETLKALADIAKDHKVNLIVPEDNFGDGMFSKLLETHVNRVYPCRIEGIRAKGNKEQRIIGALAPVMRQHRLVFDRRVIEEDLKAPQAHQGFYQITHMSEAKGALKHDDMADVLAMAAAHWAEYLNADANRAEADRIKKAEEEFDARFMNHVIGSSLNRRPSGIAARRGVGRPVGRRR